MTEEKILQQAEIEALLKANGEGQDTDSDQIQQQEVNGVNVDNGTLDQTNIDAMLAASQKPADDVTSGEMSQADIDAMLGGSQGAAEGAATAGEMSQADIDALLSGSQGSADDAVAATTAGEMSQADIDALLKGGLDDTDAMSAPMEETAQQPQAAGDLQEELSVTEKDALGEVGNISMGAAATTLSQLLNRRVDITSPSIQIIPQRDFIASFKSPFLVIQVQFTDGFEGHNVLVIKLNDAKVMADLMMGGDGTNLSDEISEIEISAAAEAMNQMIGTSSTALADLMDKSINIAPPEVVVVQELEKTDVNLPFENPLVVISFDLIIKDLVDTSIMQVIDIKNAREQARALLGSFGLMDDYDEVVAEAETAAAAAADALLESHDAVESAAPAPQRVTVGETIAQQPTAQSKPKVAAVKASPAAPPGRVQEGMAQVDAQKLSLLLDIPLKVSVVLGRTKKSIKEVLSMTPGAIAELETIVEEPVDVLVNGKLVAKGEVVVVNENFGVKITSIISTTERIHSLGE